MSGKRKKTDRAVSIPIGLCIGTAVSMGITLLLSALTAWLALQGKVKEDTIGYCAMGILALSSAAGAYIAVNRIKRRKVQVSYLAGVCYYLTLVACTALLFGGQYSGMCVTALVVLAGCTIPVLAITLMGRNKAKQKWKKAYR